MVRRWDMCWNASSCINLFSRASRTYMHTSNESTISPKIIMSKWFNMLLCQVKEMKWNDCSKCFDLPYELWKQKNFFPFQPFLLQKCMDLSTKLIWSIHNPWPLWHFYQMLEYTVLWLLELPTKLESTNIYIYNHNCWRDIYQIKILHLNWIYSG